MAAKLDFEERRILNSLMEKHYSGDLDAFGIAVWSAATDAAVAKFTSTNSDMDAISALRGLIAKIDLVPSGQCTEGEMVVAIIRAKDVLKLHQ